MYAWLYTKANSFNLIQILCFCRFNKNTLLVLDQVVFTEQPGDQTGVRRAGGGVCAAPPCQEDPLWAL